VSRRSARRRPQKRAVAQARGAAALGLLTIGTGATVIVAPSADAATLSVTNLGDSGAGSLRAAVAAANAAPGLDTIDIAVTGVIQLTSGELEINDAVTITGPGAGQVTVDAGGHSRVFEIFDGPVSLPVVISGLTMTNGSAPTHEYYYAGTTLEAQESGGALVETITPANIYGVVGSLELDDVVITDSQAGAGGAVDAGNVNLTINDSTLSGNTAVAGGGGLMASGDTTIVGTTVSDNSATAGGGGGLWMSVGRVAVVRSTVSGNTAEWGGGIEFHLRSEEHTSELQSRI